MCKIVISGYYGFNNLGDEAILETMVNSFIELDDKTQIYVLTGNPTNTKQNIDVNVVHRYKIFDVLKVIAKSDIFISGGGSLLQDSTGKWSIRYYLGLIWWALVCRKKVFLYAHGIGPINGRLNKFLMKIILRHVDIVTVRDERSKKDLISYGLKDNKIYLSADPVIGMSRVDKNIGSTILRNSFDRVSCQYHSSKPLIGFSLRAKDFPTPESRNMLKLLIDSLTIEYKIVLLPFHLDEDMELCEWASKHQIPAITDVISAKDMMSIVENLDLLVGERLHSLIFAAVAGISFLGISYDPKIDAFMKMFNMKPICNISDFDNVNISDKISGGLRKNDLILEAQNKKVDNLISEFQVNTDILAKLLKNCRKD